MTFDKGSSKLSEGSKRKNTQATNQIGIKQFSSVSENDSFQEEDSDDGEADKKSRLTNKSLKM